MTAALDAIAELRERAQRKHKRLARLRRDPRYRRVLGAFVQAKLLTTNDDVEPVKGPVELEEVLWAGRLEPRLLELLPAVLIKKPAMIQFRRLPPDLDRVLERLKKTEAPEEFRGIPGTKLLEWLPLVGHKGKLPTQLKAFRFRKEDVELLEKIAAERGLTETDVVRAGLRALSER